MYDKLKRNFKQMLHFTDEELNLVDKHFEKKILRKKEFLLKDNEICNFIAFIDSGLIRHFHINDGIEKTCDISFENTWVTDFQSFNSNTSGIINFQAMESSMVFLISKDKLLSLYQKCHKYETFGRLMAEKIAQRNTEIAISFSSFKPEDRYENLLNEQPQLFQRIPQKHIASLIGVSPESFSRIRNRILKKKKS